MLSDEDIINLNVIDWIIEIIKNHEDFSQILGKIGIKGNIHKDILYDYQCKNQILNPGYQSLSRLFFQHGYFSGIILKRDVFDLKRAKKYVGCAYMHQILMTQAMVKGKTITTPKIICYQNYESDISAERDLNITIKSFKKISISPFSPLSRFTQMQFKRKLLYDLLRNSPKTKEKLLNQERVSAAKLLAITFYKSPYLFLKLLPLILRTIDYSRSLTFWKHLPIKFIKYFYIMIIKSRKGLLMFFKELIFPNSENIRIYPPWKHDKNIHG